MRVIVKAAEDGRSSSAESSAPRWRTGSGLALLLAMVAFVAAVGGYRAGRQADDAASIPSIPLVREPPHNNPGTAASGVEPDDWSGVAEAARMQRDASDLGESAPVRGAELAALIRSAVSPAERGRLWQRLAGSDLPQVAREFLSLATSRTDASEGLRMICGAWAATGPREALDFALGLQSRSLREEALRGVFESLPASNPALAWEMAKELPAGSGDPPMLKVLSQWARRDPASALSASASIPDRTTRSEAMAEVYSSWAGENLPAALAYATALQDAAQRAQALSAISRAQVDHPSTVLDAVLEHVPVGAEFDAAVGRIVSGWAREDPSAAAAALRRLPAGSVPSSAIAQVATEWTLAGGYREALEWIGGLPQSEARGRATRALFEQLSRQDPQKASAAMQALPNGDRGVAASILSNVWARQDPQAAIDWAVRFPATGMQANLVASAVSRWASYAPVDALGYTTKLPADQRGPAQYAAMAQWVSHDAESAAAWIDRQPRGGIKDSYVGLLARQLVAEDPQSAVKWVATISDEAKRISYLTSVVRAWARRDRVAARRWVAGSGLPHEVQVKLNSN